MNVAVISDTHVPRFRGRLARALDMVAAEKPELILHCGDLTTLEAIEAFEAIAPVEAVAGNNDGDEIERRYGRRKIVAAGGLRIGMIHGDGARGTTQGRARAAFFNEDAAPAVDVIVFGHSHEPLIERYGNLWLVNPGSVTDKRRQSRYSFAMLERGANGAFAPRLIYFDAE